MAKQLGILPLEGTITNITFLKTQDGFIAKYKSEVDKERIKTSPTYARTRENNSEFDRAAKGGEILRETFTTAILHCTDNRVTSRLLTRLKQCINADTTSMRGDRNLVDGDDTLLQGFHWNKFAGFIQIMRAPFTVAIDRTAGTATVAIPPFIPTDQLIYNSEATHYKITMAAAEIDWNGPIEGQLVDVASTGMLPLDDSATTAISQALTLTAGTVLPIVVSLSITWYQQVNGNYYPLFNKDYDAASIVKVDQV